MKDKIIAYLLHYWLAMNAAGYQSAKITATTFFATAGIHTVFDTEHALTLYQLAGILLLSFGHGLLNYLEANPLKLPLPAAPAPGSPLPPVQPSK